LRVINKHLRSTDLTTQLNSIKALEENKAVALTPTNGPGLILSSPTTKIQMKEEVILLCWLSIFPMPLASRVLFQIKCTKKT